MAEAESTEVNDKRQRKRRGEKNLERKRRQERRELNGNEKIRDSEGEKEKKNTDH